MKWLPLTRTLVASCSLSYAEFLIASFKWNTFKYLASRLLQSAKLEPTSLQGPRQHLYCFIMHFV
uniref:Uncharacterized protein n=1 Tax=Arundo donax TaxID=35708 RepID=A0A0A9HTK0_ARUDO